VTTIEPEALALIERQRGWNIQDQRLIRDIAFRDFPEALRFVERVADVAVDYHRRPDMCISDQNRVRLTIENLHHAGLTLAEARLAEKVNAVLDEHHPDAASHA
jgi:4a-hydroxytetrahydrobiopterin dehydratase